MANTDKMEAILKLPDSYLTKKNLNEAGVKDHQINSYIKAGFIVRIGRNTYKITDLVEKLRSDRLKKELVNNWNNCFSELLNYIRSKKYSDAYESLEWLLNNRGNSEFDDNLKAYVLLLENILEIKDSLLTKFEFEHNVLNDGARSAYYSYYLSFLSDIEKGNMNKANEALKIYIGLEKQRKKFNSENVIVIKNLFEEVLKNSNINNDSVDNGKSVDDKIKNAIRAVNLNFELGNLSVVEELLNERKERIPFDEIVLNMIKAYKYFVCDNKFVLSYKSKEEYEKDNLVEQFVEALKLNEEGYAKAYMIVNDPNWSKEAKKHPDREYLYLFKRILFKLNDISEKNLKRITYKEMEPVIGLSAEYNDNYEKFLEWLDQVIKVNSNNNKINGLRQISFELRKDDCDYIAIYEMFMEDEEIAFLGNETLETIELFLEKIICFKAKELFELEDKYNESLAFKNYDGARKYLNEYSKLIKDTKNERDITYQYDRVDSYECTFEQGYENERQISYMWGMYYYNEGRYDDCIKEMDIYVSLFPHDVIAGYLLIGRAYMAKGNIDIAVDYFDKVMDINKEMPDVYSAFGEGEFASENYDMALKYFNEYYILKGYYDIDALEKMCMTYVKLCDQLGREKEIKNRYRLSRRLERARHIEEMVKRYNK